ncbi:hypothetical protein [Scytonema sp. PCC 10023]|uniref:hypothetical protein n=1 Tax=Scytonema sp. PCC 10023 TaxID=1680591 RepID=UPI0039C69C6C
MNIGLLKQKVALWKINCHLERAIAPRVNFTIGLLKLIVVVWNTSCQDNRAIASPYSVFHLFEPQSFVGAQCLAPLQCGLFTRKLL